MSKYIVYAKKGYDCFLEVEAESEDQAMEIAANTDASEFTPSENDGLYIDYAEECEEELEDED